MKYKTIKIDTAFDGCVDRELLKSLEDGWIILDKTITGDRYIYFVLKKSLFVDNDIGKSSYSTKQE